MSGAPRPVARDEAAITGRIERTATIGALVISALIVIASATSWSRLGLALAIVIGAAFANVAVSRALVPRYGSRAEVWRMLLNSAVTCSAYWAIDWPLPVWLWLPFTAVTLDELGGPNTRGTVIAQCLIQDASGLASGVHWIYPLSFTVLAAFCWVMAGVRVRMIRDMLRDAEERRDALAQAHARLQEEIAARARAELELRHAQKLEAIGRLASGIAHEINTPVQYIGDNVQFVRESVAGLMEVRARYAAGDRAAAEALEAEIDLPYLAEHVPQALDAASEGCGRVATIVRSMKRFAHRGGPEAAPADLVDAVEVTLAIARSEYAHVAEIVRRLEPVPPVRCDIGEINQVLLNLIVNAAHAIEDAGRGEGGAGRGTITVASRVEGGWAVVTVGDDGCGIPAELRERMFEPFFTTKVVGRGTGQGLSVSRAMVERHGGTLTFETEVGRGTTFELRLPLRGAGGAAAQAAQAA